MERPAWTAQCTNRKLIGELLPVRRRESHKGDYGRVLLLCGSEGLTGAARLAAKAALRTGSGLVYLGVPEKIYPIIAAGAGSEIVFPLPCDGAGRLCMASLPVITERLPEMDAVLLGPGLGRSEELTRLVQAVLSICRVPLVLDADGINAAAPHIDVLRGCACPVVLTPHDGEFLRLGGDPKAADRTQEARRLADRTHAVLLLKGDAFFPKEVEIGTLGPLHEPPPAGEAPAAPQGQGHRDQKAQCGARLAAVQDGQVLPRRFQRGHAAAGGLDVLGVRQMFDPALPVRQGGGDEQHVRMRK